MTDYDGRTALHVAVCQGHLDVVQYILNSSSRSSLHCRDALGHSPLDDAVKFRHFKIIELLRQTGAHLTMPAAKVGMFLCQYVDWICQKSFPSCFFWFCWRGGGSLG